MANEDARENGVLGKALGMAAVVGMTGVGMYAGAKGVSAGIGGIKKGVKSVAKDIADYKSNISKAARGVDTSTPYNTMSGDRSILGSMQGEAMKDPNVTLKNAAKEVSSNSKNRAIGEGGVSTDMENGILAASMGGKPMEEVNPMHTPKSISWSGGLPEVKTEPLSNMETVKVMAGEVKENIKTAKENFKNRTKVDVLSPEEAEPILKTFEANKTSKSTQLSV